MPVFASNFTANSLSGTVKVSGGTANIRLVVEPIAFEGTKQFVLKIRKDSAEGAVLGTTSNITIVDNSSIVSVTANTATVLEGNLVSFTISTANVPNNANVYFSVLPASANITSQDFEANTGRFTIVNNVATFALKANADLSLMDESGETFKLQVRTVSPVGNIVFTTSNIAITDFSKGYGTIFLTPSATNYFENNSMIFQLRSYNAANAVLYYSTTGGNAAASNFIANTGSFTVGADNFANITLTANTNIPIDETRTFQLQVRIGDASGTVMATSDLVTIRDINLAPVIGTGGTLSRSNGYVIHTFTNPGTFTINKSSNIQYLLVGAGGRAGWGGGGGGGVLYGNTTINTGTYPILVGRDGGGNGMPQWAPVAAPTGSGGNTVFSGFIAYGGGGGGFSGAMQGGSGGGGGRDGGGTNPGGGSVAGQGNPGGDGSVPGPWGGGGGGAGGAVTGSAGQIGGNGRLLDISGIATYYGGGGGGWYSPTGGDAPGGLGSGPAFYGGGASRTNGAANGVAIIRYVGANYVSISKTPSPLNDGANVTFTMTTLNVTNGTFLYWKLVGPNTLNTDFLEGNAGTLLFSNNSNVFNLRAAPIMRSGLDTYASFQVSIDSPTGEVVFATDNIPVYSNAVVGVASVTGGVQSNISGYRIHTFTSSGVINFSRPMSNVEILMAAGGGGGGGSGYTVGAGGGGGAGGLVLANISSISYGNTTIFVGAGGSGGGTTGGMGGNSYILSPAGYVGNIAVGGGYGTLGFPGDAGNGGSGGGMGPGYNITPGWLFATGIAGQGFPGGGSPGPSGGGGAGGAGSSSPPRAGGAGGISTFSGSSVTYSIGGNGGNPAGGASAGAAGVGYGGGGSGGSGTPGAASGGSGNDGIIIIRYPV
jgi:hypothetical protein